MLQQLLRSKTFIFCNRSIITQFHLHLCLYLGRLLKNDKQKRSKHVFCKRSKVVFNQLKMIFKDYESTRNIDLPCACNFRFSVTWVAVIVSDFYFVANEFLSTLHVTIYRKSYGIFLKIRKTNKMLPGNLQTMYKLKLAASLFYVDYFINTYAAISLSQ